jgi:hypothetical protein
MADSSNPTVDALKIDSLPRYLCKNSRSGIADRRPQVAANAKAPTGVMLGKKLAVLVCVEALQVHCILTAPSCQFSFAAFHCHLQGFFATRNNSNQQSVDILLFNREDLLRLSVEYTAVVQSNSVKRSDNRHMAGRLSSHIRYVSPGHLSAQYQHLC